MAKKHVVKNMTLDELSGVDRPANAPSKFVLLKRLASAVAKKFGKGGMKDCPDCKPGEPCPEHEGMDEMAKADSPHVAAAVPALTESLATSITSIFKHGGDRIESLVEETLEQFREAVLALPSTVVKMEEDGLLQDEPLNEDNLMNKKYVERLEAELSKRGVDPADLQDDDDAGVDEIPVPAALAKRLAVLEADSIALKALVKSTAQTERLQKARLIKGNAPVEDADVAELLSQLDGAGTETLSKLLKQLDGFAEISAVFKEFGSTGSEESMADPETQLEKLAADFMAKDPKLTRPVALAKAYEARPDLYELAEAGEED